MPRGTSALPPGLTTRSPRTQRRSQWVIASILTAISADAGPLVRAAAAAESFDIQNLARAPLSEILSHVAVDPSLAGHRERFIADAKKDAARPVLHRPHDLPGLRRWRVPLKYDVRPPQASALGEKEWETFCLSQGDNNAGALLKAELPRLAAAATLTGEPALIERTLAQLRELATWEPLERRGWSLRNSKPRLSGDDGAWLGTGWLVRAIVDAVEILPPRHVPTSLRAALKSRLEAELSLMEEDWAQKRPWYFRNEAPHSNQWILPNEALVRACLFLGVDSHRETYDRGVRNLLRSMDVQGREGEFVEGLRYSGLSLESLYSIARATARSGDERLRAHPYLRKFPIWLAHHFQPGGFLINAFDSPGSSRGYLTRDQGLFATAAVVTGNTSALWALITRAGFGDTLEGILAAKIPASLAAAPPLHANYSLATRLNWRSSWDDDTASGLWLRGGHPSDFHDHMDRGHVNFIVGQRPVLIEAGTLNYAVPNYATHMRSVAGHNVLQVGDASPDRLTPTALEHAGQILDGERRAAPIFIERMDERGGVASVDASKCYASVAMWRRRVKWDRDAVAVEDDLEFRQGDIAQFRWHLGTPAAADRSIANGRIEVGGILMTFEADHPLVALVEPMPDATLALGKITEHACVVMKTVGPVLRLRLKTRIGLTEAMARARGR